MKTLTAFTVFLLVLFISSGRNEMKVEGAIGNCDVVLHGGGCEVNECDGGCKQKYGETAHGFCYPSSNPNDVLCVCRYNCS